MRSKFMIQMTALALVILSVVSLAWSLTSPISVAAPRSLARARKASQVAVDKAQPESNLEQQWDRLFSRRFQKPLYDPPPPKPAPVVKKEIPPPPIKVLATMVEPGGGFATIQDNSGNVRVLQVGATIAAGGTTAKLLQVHEDSVELEHEGKVITMKLHIK